MEGKPVPQARPRLSRGGAYTPKSQWRKNLTLEARYLAPIPFHGVPLHMEIDLRIPRPKSHYNTKGFLKADSPEYPILVRAGDVDNYAKAVMDALNGIVYTDDSQIVWLQVRKDYAPKGSVGYTIVRVYE